MGRAAAFVVVAGLVLACTAEPGGPAGGGPSASGGAGGSVDAGGTGGASGSAGADASVEGDVQDAPPTDAGSDGVLDAAPDAKCQTGAECSDGLACNGVEACVASQCVPGAAPCSNPSSAHCSVTCTETGTAIPKCTIAPLDADGDGHGDAECPSAGNDCDDKNAGIHPGAAESCDGLDSNCNGKSDPEDLGFKSSAKNFASGRAPATAYATSAGKFGVAWGFPVEFALLGLDGLPASAPIAVGGESSDDVSVAWGDDSFAVVYADTSVGNREVYFRRISDAGVAMGPAKRLTFDLATSRGARVVRSGQDWIVTWFDTRDGVGHLYAKRLAADGTPKGSDQRVIAGSVHEELHPVIASAGSSLGLVWAARTFDESETWIWAGVLDPTTLTISTPLLLEHAVKPARVTIPVLAGDTSGFAVAWGRDSYSSPAGEVAMARLTPSGSLSCGPVVAYSQTTRSPWPHAIAITPTGAAIAGISRKFLSYNDLFMLRTAGAACALSGPVDTLSSLNVSIADIAAGPLGTALVWDETTASKVHSRVFGPLWCN